LLRALEEAQEKLYRQGERDLYAEISPGQKRAGALTLVAESATWKLAAAEDPSVRLRRRNLRMS